MADVTIIVPCYNEEKTILILLERLRKVFIEMQDKEFIVLFIDDGSFDNTLEIIKEEAKNDKKIKYLSFSRNFGKESAILAGLNYTKTEYAILMDADMQDPPEMIPHMWDIMKAEKCNRVAARRVNRKGEPKIKSCFARLFYKIINKISDVEIADGARDFCLMDRKVINAVCCLPERNRFTKGIFGWIGFKTCWLEYENQKRIAGETKWSFWKLFKYSMEGITSFSTIPLLLSSWLGLILCAISTIILIAYVIIVLKVGGDVVEGRPTIICVTTFLGGIQLLCIGVLGQYLAKLFNEIKCRPNYIINESNLQKDTE